MAVLPSPDASVCLPRIQGAMPCTVQGAVVTHLQWLVERKLYHEQLRMTHLLITQDYNRALGIDISYIT